MSVPVFVWRGDTPPTHPMRGLCRYCSAKTASRYIGDPNDKDMDPELLKHWRSSYDIPDDDPGWGHGACMRATCPRCGWWINCGAYNTGPVRTLNAVLRNFDINDSQLAVPEICSHLARTFSDVYHLSSRQFEEVVAQVYREMGWEVILTPQTRDGGVDLYCLRNRTGETCIVECKRYSADRRVGIFAVDRLLGVTIRTAADNAHLVTSSAFSIPAQEAAAQAADRGVCLQLVDGHFLLKMLGAYSNPDITPKDLVAIFADVESHESA